MSINVSGIFSNAWLVFCKNAEKKGLKPVSYLFVQTFKILSYTIPGFLVVLLFPINSDEEYGWFSGIWQGWFGLCNMVIKIFSPDTLYIAPISTTAYDILWWVCFVYADLLLPSLFIVPFYQVHEKKDKDFHFVDPSKVRNNEHTQRDGIRTKLGKRVLKIFISSTFQDMREERDYLMRHTFPELKRLAAQRGVDIVPVDLRWGITEEESKSGKVLELCLQEIDNAIPFFIGIIGKRYGWCPSEKEFQKSALLKERYPWIVNDFKQHLSVTEIEFQYGALRRKERINAAFFGADGAFIVSVDENSERGKVDRLKKAILKDGRYPLINVSGGPEILGNEVFKMYVKFLDQYFPMKNSSGNFDMHDAVDYTTSVWHFIEDYLARYGKKLSKSQTDTIIAHPLSQNRTVLKSLLDELISFGDFNELDRHIAFLLDVQTPSQFYQKLLECYENQYGKKPVKNFFSIMRLTGYGLKVEDALVIADVGVKTPDIDYSDIYMSPLRFVKDFGKSLMNTQRLPFDQYFQAYLERNGDVIRLNHEWMKQAVDERYLSDAKVVVKYRKHISSEVEFFLDMYNSSPKNTNRIEEVIYQKLMLGKVSDIKDYMNSSGSYVIASYLSNYRPELYQKVMKYMN